MPLPSLEEKDGLRAVRITRAEAELARRALIVFAQHIPEPHRTVAVSVALRFRALARQPQEAAP